MIDCRGRSGQARPFQALEKVSFFPDWFGAAGLDELVIAKLQEDQIPIDMDTGYRLKCNCPSMGVGLDPQIDFAI